VLQNVSGIHPLHEHLPDKQVVLDLGHKLSECRIDLARHAAMKLAHSCQMKTEKAGPGCD
jgi:hypothetical protein